MNRRPSRTRRHHRLRLGPHGSGDQAGPLVAAWTLDGLAELAALHEADSPEALHRLLVIPGRRAATNCSEIVAAFCRAHALDDTALMEAVGLAATHQRWRKVARQMLDGLHDHGVLDPVTDVLALIFLEADTVPVTAPGAWLVDYYRQLVDGEPRPLDPDETYTITGTVSPQLRRWAASRSVWQRDNIGPVLARALTLDNKHGAAVVLGLLDATKRLDPDTVAHVLDIGLDWPSPAVRLTALKQLAATGRDRQALERAETDRAAHIRRWAATHGQLMLHEPDDQSAEEPRDDHAEAGNREPDQAQPTLLG